MRDGRAIILFILLLCGVLGAVPTHAETSWDDDFIYKDISVSMDTLDSVRLPRIGHFSEDGLGKKLVLGELNVEKPLLIFFWAFWCPNCQGEIESVNQLQKKTRGEPFQIVGIHIAENPALIEVYLNKRSPIDFPIFHDEENEAADVFGVMGVPTIILLAKGGKILYYGFSLPSNPEGYFKKEQDL